MDLTKDLRQRAEHDDVERGASVDTARGSAGSEEDDKLKMTRSLRTSETPRRIYAASGGAKRSAASQNAVSPRTRRGGVCRREATRCVSPQKSRASGFSKVFCEAEYF